MSLPQISNLTNDLTSCKYSKSFDSTSTSKYVISNSYDTKLQIELEYSSNEGSSAIKTWTPTNGSSVDSDYCYDTKHTITEIKQHKICAVQIQNSMVLMRDQMLRFYDSVLYTFILYY
jgi:hypothetical protein